MSDLQALIDRQKDESFTEEYRPKATDEEGLGILVAHYFRWDGAAILRTFFEALEDANFHSEAAVVQEMIERERV